MANEKMNEIKTVFAKWLNTEQAPAPETSLRDLGLDSLDVVEMCLELEEKFGIKFEYGELAAFQTVGDLYNAIEGQLA